MAARKSTAKAEAETPTEKVGDICGACWPLGWPHTTHSASCEHGTYVRDPEQAPPVQDPPPVPEDDGNQDPQDPTTPPADPAA